MSQARPFVFHFHLFWRQRHLIERNRVAATVFVILCQCNRHYRIHMMRERLSLDRLVRRPE